MLITDFGITPEVAQAALSALMARASTINEPWAKDQDYVRQIMQVLPQDDMPKSPGGVYLTGRLDKYISEYSPLYEADWLFTDLDTRLLLDYRDYGYVDSPDDVFELLPAIRQSPHLFAVGGYWHTKSEYSDEMLWSRGWPTYKNGDYYGKYQDPATDQVSVDRVFNYHVYLLTPKG